MARLHSPFDAVELATDAVARGNLKVFAEIGYEFARYLSLDFDAFMAACARRSARRPATASQALPRYARRRRAAQAMLLANLAIGLHEQTRLQPEIAEALDAPYVTLEELGASCLWPDTVRPLLHKRVGASSRPSRAGWPSWRARRSPTR